MRRFTMTFTSDAYLKHEFIKKSVDLLCAGAAWQGGSFVVDPTNESSKITPQVDTESLFSISKSLLLTGECILAILSNDSNEIKFINRDEIDQNPIYTIIQRSISSFMPEGDPILKGFDSQLELYEDTFDLISGNPAIIPFFKNARSSIHSALAIQPYMLDQDLVLNTPAQSLMASAIQYKSEVSNIRHNIKFGLDNLGMQLAQSLDLDYLSWEWNKEWIPQGQCKYGHVYQVFLSQGIALEPIKENELGALNIGVETGLIPQSLYTACKSSYS